jgi:hypothetical protein
MEHTKKFKVRIFLRPTLLRIFFDILYIEGSKGKPVSCLFSLVSAVQ